MLMTFVLDGGMTIEASYKSGDDGFDPGQWEVKIRDLGDVLVAYWLPEQFASIMALIIDGDGMLCQDSTCEDRLHQLAECGLYGWPKKFRPIP